MFQSDDDTFCIINFRPNVKLVSVVRRFVSDFYEHILADPDATSRVALATHELLENAVKHSCDGETTLRLDVDQDDQGGGVINITVVNKADEPSRDAVKAVFREMYQQPDAFAYYQQIMLRNAKRMDGSGLGLARIRAEAEMDLRCEIEGDEVRVHARAPVQLKVKSDGR